MESDGNTSHNPCRRLLTVKTVAARPVAAGPITVTPVAKTLTLRCGRAFRSWSWPFAVLVEDEAGGEAVASRVRIVDVTRLAQIVIVVVTALSFWGLVAGVARRKGRLS
jgi:hypothetical protein